MVEWRTYWEQAASWLNCRPRPIVRDIVVYVEHLGYKLLRCVRFWENCIREGPPAFFFSSGKIKILGSSRESQWWSQEKHRCTLRGFSLNLKIGAAMCINFFEEARSANQIDANWVAKYSLVLASLSIRFLQSCSVLFYLKLWELRCVLDKVPRFWCMFVELLPPRVPFKALILPREPRSWAGIKIGSIWWRRFKRFWPPGCNQSPCTEAGSLI